MQVRSADDVPTNEGYSPCALQVLKAVHVSALALVLNSVVPSHAVQVRSVVALGCCVTRSPFAQTVCFAQKLTEGALGRLLYVPLGHGCSCCA